MMKSFQMIQIQWIFLYKFIWTNMFNPLWIFSKYKNIQDESNPEKHACQQPINSVINFISIFVAIWRT